MTNVESPPSHEGSTSSDARGYILTVHAPSDTRAWPLDHPRAVVGRGDDCDVVVPDPTVSRRHLVLEFERGVVRFRDLGGTNRPVLDGRPTTEGVLAPGSWLVIGMTRIEVSESRRADGKRAIDDPDRTARIVRRDLRPTHGGAVSVDALRALEALRRPSLSGPDFVIELAPHLLATALALTGRTRGVLALAPPDGAIRILASIPPDPAEFPLPSGLRKGEPGAVAIDPCPPGSPESERLVVPLATHDHGVLVVGHPPAGSMPGERALDVIVAFADIAARELEEARWRELAQRELERSRFSRSYASRAILVATRLQPLRRHVAEAASHGQPLGLLGEDGCETEEIARFYHAHSMAGAGPFVACYARLLPPDRLAQELAPSGGIQERGGTCAQRARGGTLFVDTPEALPPELQLELARVVESNCSAPEQDRFRLILSLVLEDDGTTPRLEPALERSLRDCVTVAVPPLRSAPRDIPALTDVVLEDMGPTPDGARRRVSPDAERLLMSYHWPGNARQHRRVVESAAAHAGADPIGARHLPIEVREPNTGELPVQTLRDVERAHILQVLALCGDNRKRTARKLGISYSTLWAKLKAYDLGD